MSIYVVLIGTLLALVPVLLALYLLNEVLPYYPLRERINEYLLAAAMICLAIPAVFIAITGIMLLWEKLIWI